MLVGTTGSGKSHLARRIFLSAPAPRMVIDPTDSELTAIPGAVTFHDPGRATNPAGENWRTAATARFVPLDPDDLDTYDAVYRWCFEHFPRRVWLDEASYVLPSIGKKSKYARRFTIAGRKRQLGHQACHTRPVEIDRNLIAQAQHVFVFDLPDADDRATVAKSAGIPLAVLETEMAGLPKYGFLHWAQEPRELTVCPPLPR